MMQMDWRQQIDLEKTGSGGGAEGGVGKMDRRRRGNMLMIKVCHYCIGWRDAFDKSLATLMDRKQRQPEN